MKEMTGESRFGRRNFLTRSALAAGAMTVGAPFDALLARQPQFQRRGRGLKAGGGTVTLDFEEGRWKGAMKIA